MTSTNPYPDLIARRLAGLGLTPEASNWVVKALHPAGPACADSMPDCDTTASLRPEFRVAKTLSRPNFENPNFDKSDWDLLIVKHPTDVTAFCWAAGTAGTDFTRYLQPADTYQGSEFMQPIIETGSNDWWQTAAPNEQIRVPLAQPDSLPGAWRKSASSITAYMVASELYNQGTVYAGQYGQAPTNDSLFVAAFPGALGGSNKFLQRQVTGFAPYSESLMTLTTPKLRTSPAKEGAYIPLRLNGPDQHFIAPGRAGSEVLYSSPTIAYYPTPTTTNFAIASMRDITDRGAGTYSDPGSYLQSWVRGSIGSGIDNVATGVILFRGLHPSASVTIKTYDQLEIRPRFDSPSRAFVVPAAPYCPHAIEAYLMLCHELLDAYPSSFNSFGTILSSIGKALLPVARAIVPGVGPVLDAVSGLISPQRVAPVPQVQIIERESVRAPRVSAMAKKKKKGVRIRSSSRASSRSRVR